MSNIIKLKLKLKHLHNCLLHSKLKTRQMAIFFLLALLASSWVLSQAIKAHAANMDRIQEGIAKDIIRFHVIANSDSKEDQKLKYQIKDALVEYLQPYLEDAKDIDDAREILSDMLPLIQDKASHVIEEMDYRYDVTASLSSTYFPMKVYGSYSFPPGQYEALQVRIGNSEGKNWWCVMFPPLCFVDETYSVVDEEGEEKLKHLLTEEEFEALKDKQVPIKVKFKIIDLIKKIFN